MTVVAKKWYVIRTKPRSEKLVYSRLEETGMETFLPTFTTMRQWSDRRRKIEVPFFTSYIFVNLTKKQFLSALFVQGAVKYVSFDGIPAIVPQTDIDNLKILVCAHAQLEISNRIFQRGQKVKVAFGLLKGLTGELVHCGRTSRLLVRIEGIDQNLLVKIPAEYLEKIV